MMALSNREIVRLKAGDHVRTGITGSWVGKIRRVHVPAAGERVFEIEDVTTPSGRIFGKGAIFVGPLDIAEKLT